MSRIKIRKRKNSYFNTYSKQNPELCMHKYFRKYKLCTYTTHVQLYCQYFTSILLFRNVFIEKLYILLSSS